MSKLEKFNQVVEKAIENFTQSPTLETKTALTIALENVKEVSERLIANSQDRTGNVPKLVEKL